MPRPLAHVRTINTPIQNRGWLSRIGHIADSSNLSHHPSSHQTPRTKHRSIRNLGVAENDQGRYTRSPIK